MMSAGLTVEGGAAATMRTSAVEEQVKRDERRLEQVAGEVVGQIFFAPLLAQMRSSGLKGEFGHGGRGEEVFGAQLDSLLASEIGKSKQSPIAEVICRRYSALQRANSRMQARTGAEWRS